jgi:hypothetical protein
MEKDTDMTTSLYAMLERTRVFSSWLHSRVASYARWQYIHVRIGLLTATPMLTCGFRSHLA